MPTHPMQRYAQNMYQPAQSMPSAHHTTIHASAPKTCILGRVVAQFMPHWNTSDSSCCTDKPIFLRTCTWSTCMLTWDSPVPLLKACAKTVGPMQLSGRVCLYQIPQKKQCSILHMLTRAVFWTCHIIPCLAEYTMLQFSGVDIVEQL